MLQGSETEMISKTVKKVMVFKVKILENKRQLLSNLISYSNLRDKN